MEKTFLDILTDEMKETMLTIRAETKDIFKGKQPYRKVKVDDADRIAQYLTLSPQVKQQALQDPATREDFMHYEASMEQKIREYGNG